MADKNVAPKGLYILEHSNQSSSVFINEADSEQLVSDTFLDQKANSPLDREADSPLDHDADSPSHENDQKSDSPVSVKDHWSDSPSINHKKNKKKKNSKIQYEQEFQGHL